MKLEEKLQVLLINGTLDDYDLVNVDEDGNIGKESKFRNTERLTLFFPNGESLVIGTFCSGSLENTTLF